IQKSVSSRLPPTPRTITQTFPKAHGKSYRLIQRTGFRRLHTTSRAKSNKKSTFQSVWWWMPSAELRLRLGPARKHCVHLKILMSHWRNWKGSRRQVAPNTETDRKSTRLN